MTRKRRRTTRWWWVRHAPVTNHDGRIYGQKDVAADVSDRAAFAALAARLPPSAVWVTSHLGRTRQTAAAIAAAGLEIGAPLIEPDIAEQNFGAWQGLTYSEVSTLKGAYHDFWIAPADCVPPGGENFVSVVTRVSRAVDRLSTAHAGRDIVAVAHGGSIRAALAHALTLEPDRALGFSIDNLSLTRMDRVDGRDGRAWRIVAVNQPVT